MAAAQGFLDKMDDQGKIAGGDLAALLKLAYKSDAAFLRSYRLNRNKSDAKLLSRLLLLLPEGSPRKAAPVPKSAGKDGVPTDDEL